MYLHKLLQKQVGYQGKGFGMLKMVSIEMVAIVIAFQHMT